MRRTFAFLLTVAVTPAALLAQQPAPAPTVESSLVAGNVYMLVGQGGNLGLAVGADGAFLIDDQFAPLHESIVEAIEELTDDPDASERVFLLNTHFHPDHTDGNELLGERGAIILAHENVRTRLTVEQVIPFFNMRHPALAAHGLPILTFTRDVTLHLNGDEIDIQHVGGPAHTDGDSIVHFKKANVIHAGDIVFIGTYPFIDLDNGGSVAGVVAAVEQIIELANDTTKIIPGHGPLIDKAGLVRFRTMLATTSDRVKEMVAAGKSLDAVRDAKPTAEFDADWSGFITTEAFVGILYRDAAGQ